MQLVWLDLNCSYAHAGIVPALLAQAIPADLGISWTVVRGTAGTDPGELARQIAAARPEVVGATLYLFNRQAVREILARVRALMPDCRIAVGGPECLGDNSALLAEFPADAVFRGEGEGPFADWLRRLHSGLGWDGIPGLCYRDRDGRIHESEGVARWDGFAASQLDTAHPLLPTDRPFIQYETARGCAGTCTFCTSGESGAVRAKPVATVARELAGLRDRGIRELRLLDRTFNLPIERCTALLRLFREEFPDLRFHLEIHPGLLAPAIRAELAQARPGQLHLEAGVQSLDPDVLARIGRQTRVDRVLDGLRFLLASTAFETHVDLLAGLPGQTFAGVLADAAQLVALEPAEIQLETLKILPGTRLAREAADLGLAFSPLPPYEVLRTPDFAEAELARAEQLSRLLDRFHNPPILRPAFRLLAPDAAALACLLDQCSEALADPVALDRRLRLLATVATDNSAATEALQLAWFGNGFGTDQAPWPNQPWQGPPPDAAHLETGTEPPDFRRVRGRHLATAGNQFWFYYDRAIDPRRPVAVYRDHP
jgi:hypothetical protein